MNADTDNRQHPAQSPSWVSFHESMSGNSSGHQFVGSPQSLPRIESSTELEIPSSSQSDHAQTHRPPFGRSVSSPVRPRANTYTRLPSLSRTIPREEHEWTVFGQLMENDGQLRTPGTTRRRRITQSQRSTSTDDDTTPRGSVADSYLGGNVQSPVIEEFADPFSGGDNGMHSDSDDSSSDSDSESDSASTFSRHTNGSSLHDHAEPAWYSPTKIPVLWRNIFKCSITYFIASLFTYNPYLSSFMSDFVSYGTGGGKPLPSGHMVATVAVYFNPAKTMGGMLEADIFCIFGLFYSALVALTGMGMFWWIEDKPGWDWLADVVAVIWIGISMSFMAWMKVWMANPQFGTACSMMSIIIFVVVVKEGGYHTLLQVTLIVLCGTLISNAVCYLIWPTTATSNLQTNMTKTLNSFSTLLGMLTDTFLLEESHNKSQGKLQRAVEAHQSSFTSLKKNLKEAKSEWVFWGRLRTSTIEEADTSEASALENGHGMGTKTIKAENRRLKAYEDAVGCLNRLGQHLNGLRSGTRLQYELLKSGVVEKKVKPRRSAAKRATQTDVLVDVTVPGEVIMPPSETPQQAEDEEETAMLKAAAAMFGDLVDDLGPPLKALSTTCITSLKRLRESFVQSHMEIHHHHHKNRTSRVFHPQEFSELASEIEKALLRFESTSNHAVMRLYRKSEVMSNFGLSSSYQHLPGQTPLSQSQNFESISSSVGSLGDSQLRQSENRFLTGDNEHVFLVYFFIFTLQEFSNELTSLVDAMERIYTIEQQRLTWTKWWTRICSIGTSVVGGFKNLWRKDTTARNGMSSRPVGSNSGGLRRRISKYIIPEKHSASRPWFPKVRPHAPNTVQTPSRNHLSFWGRMKQRIWWFGKRMRERDTKYAIKTGMATAILAAPAFFERTRPYFVRFYGDWALISYFVVMSPTIGQTNFMGVHRILGTLFSAAVAAGVYTLFPENAIVLSLFGFFYSIPCFYFLVGQPKYAPSARFVLLTYNLTCLYCYNLRVKDLSVIEVAKYRALAVTVGVSWAWLVSRFWWPSEARRELSRALGEFCLNMGWLYTRLVASNSFNPEYKDDDDDDRRASGRMTIQQTRLNNSIQEFMAMELHLQIKLIELQGLLSQTEHEPRLKGPFPVALYRNILTSLQTILDRLHSMRCVTTREEWYTSVRQDFILPVQSERRDMVGNIILFFSTLAAAFQLKAPLPPYLPPAEESRQRLVEAIRKLDIVRSRDVKGSRQLLFFAYALTMKGVTQELKVLGRTLQDAFGVIGQSPEEFEALFEKMEDRREY